MDLQNYHEWIAERLNGNTGYPITYCCELLDRSKQAYYKRQKRDEEYLFRVMRIVDAVKQIRQMDPGIGYSSTKSYFSVEKVNVSSTKSTNPGKGTTKAGKQTT